MKSSYPSVIETKDVKEKLTKTTGLPHQGPECHFPNPTLPTASKQMPQHRCLVSLCMCTLSAMRLHMRMRARMHAHTHTPTKGC